MPQPGAGPTPPSDGPRAGRTLGAEEELQLLDGASFALVSRAPEVLAATSDPGLVAELPASQVEAVTPVCASLAEVRAELVRLRGEVARAAATVGLRAASCGLPPVADWRANEVNPEPAYAPLRAAALHLVDEQLIAGLHVHVGVPDPDDAVRALDGLRPWLPVLLALSASSPVWDGQDTGFASWRTVHWRRWPVSGPPPHSGTPEGYAAHVAALLASEVITQESQVYWDARRSARFPTVEVRVCDAVPTVDEAVALVGLARALVRVGVEEPVRYPVPDGVLRVASWVAARRGLSAHLQDPLTGTPRPAAEVVGMLLDRVRPVLEGDADDVLPVVARLLAEGGSAQRQRRAIARGGVRAAAELVADELLA